MIVTKYEELEFYIKMFKDGNCDLLILSSSAGLGKSSIVAEAMQETNHLMINSHASPMSLYIAGHEHVDEPIIFQDCDGLLYNNDNIGLLKQFTETREIKKVSWFTTNKSLDGLDIPNSYETKSRCLIETNNLDYLTKKILPLKDRGWLIQFQPSKAEILQRIDKIRKCYGEEGNDEVFALISRLANYSNTISLRTFIKGINLFKQCNGVGWEERLMKEMEINPKLQLMDRILQTCQTDNEALECWNQNNLGRTSFFEYRKKLSS